MPGANAEVVFRGYEALNRGDIDAALELMQPDIEWHTYLVPGPGGGCYRGHDGVRELWGDARNIFGDFRNEPRAIADLGDQIAVAVVLCGRGKASGVEVEARIAHLFTFRDGLVASVRSFENMDEALAAAGSA
jgi:ketosteroid isomerase-like protein